MSISSFCFSDGLELHPESMRLALVTAYRQLARLADALGDDNGRAELVMPAMILNAVIDDLEKYITATKERE